MISPQVCALLRSCQFDPSAVATYDVMAGGLIWSDEIPLQEPSDKPLRIATHLRSIIAFRASVCLGEPREELRSEWDQFQSQVPSWPGFLEERIVGRAERLLRAHRFKEAKYLRGPKIDQLLGQPDVERP